MPLGFSIRARSFAISFRTSASSIRALMFVGLIAMLVPPDG